MGFFNSISRALGSLSPLSDEEPAEEHETVRLRYAASGDFNDATKLYNELHRYDGEMIRRASDAYDRENPNPPEGRHREHGWHLPNDN